MPKIIKNLELRLLEEARKQINENGYGTMTIRSVAAACGVGVGTVYNYFQSKDELIAAYMLKDWAECIAVLNELGSNSAVPKVVACGIYEQLRGYANRHQFLMKDEAARSSFAGSFGRYHSLLRQQLAKPLRKFCANDFTAEFIAEALLTWTMEGNDFDEIYGVIDTLFM